MDGKKLVRNYICGYCNCNYIPTRKDRKYCSISCSTKNSIKNNPNNGLQKGHKLRDGLSPWNKNLTIELDIRCKAMSTNKKGECRNTGRTHFKEGMRPWNWNGGNSKNRKYNNRKWKELAVKIYKRDNYTCFDCDKVGGLLNAHHLKPWCKYPELAFKENNIITLCVRCHGIRHNANNTKRISRNIEEVRYNGKEISYNYSF